MNDQINDDLWDLMPESRPVVGGARTPGQRHDAMKKALSGAGSWNERETLTSGSGSIQTGRSGAGNLRNYKAMSDEKLEGVINDVVREDNDAEAMIALLKEVARRYT